MPHSLINQLETAQRITLGQVDQEAITMAVECADPLAIVKHGRVESYLVSAELMQSLIEAHNTALGEMGKRVAESVPVELGYTTEDIGKAFAIDVGGINKAMSDLSRAFENDPAIAGMKAFKMPLVKVS